MHVHGARVPSKDDGHPDDWFVPGQSLACNYPLQQEGTTLWYHDHAMGLNRLNVYAGLFGMMLVRDKAEDALNLPTGKHEVPLILYDRNFTTDGQLYYPDSGDPAHPWVSEFAGDAILVNGKIRPYFEVEPRLYRFRMVNAANSRFFRLSLSNKQTRFIRSAETRVFCPHPVEHSAVHLRSGRAPRPARRLQQCRGPDHPSPQRRLRHPAIPRRRQPRAAKLRLHPEVDSHHRTPSGVLRHNRRRTITLNEYQDGVGNSMEMLLNRKRWHEPVTERPRLNTIEIWEFVNLTEDVHPMHLHLVRFQILDRRVFDTFAYLMYKQLKFTAAAEPPAANESGWKDVIQCPPGMITRIIVKFEGYTGDYLYHCHILEHEANDMMRPFQVIA